MVDSRHDSQDECRKKRAECVAIERGVGHENDGDGWDCEVSVHDGRADRDQHRAEKPEQDREQVEHWLPPADDKGTIVRAHAHSEPTMM